MAKVKLVLRLQKISDLASFIPLFLGDALALYFELSEEDQLDADKIRSMLKTALMERAFSAYAKLGKMRWAGEAVNVYASDNWRQAKLAGF